MDLRDFRVVIIVYMFILFETLAENLCNNKSCQLYKHRYDYEMSNNTSLLLNQLGNIC